MPRRSSLNLDCRSMLAVVAMLLGGCAGLVASVHPDADRSGLSLDDSMLPLCKKVLASDESAVPQLAAHPVTRKMSEGMREQVAFTPEEFAAAAFSPAEDQRFSWRRLRDNSRFVLPFVEQAPARLAAMLRRDVVTASELVADSARPNEVLVHLVCGGPWDAYVLYFDRGAELFLDIGWQADGELDSVMPDVEAILTHELWHMAFGEHIRARWPTDYKHSGDAAALFIYEMVNEGIGHYYSMRPHLYPTNTIERFADKAARAFGLLAASYPALVAERDEKRRSDMLWHSHAGVPFWEKWGAVTGALVVYRLVETLGRDGVRALLSNEPFSLLLAYDEQCATHADWARLPAALVHDARALKERGLAAGEASAQQ
jgi:hypothetical protein